MQSRGVPVSRGDWVAFELLVKGFKSIRRYKGVLWLSQ